MALMDCRPHHTYRPDFTPSEEQCSAPTIIERRSRLRAGGTLFRSRAAGESANDIAIEIVRSGNDVYLNVYLLGVLVETHGPVDADVTGSPVTYVAAGDMRAIVNANSTLIEMPTSDCGGERTDVPSFVSANLPTDDPAGDGEFVDVPVTSLGGGTGFFPTDTATIRTGPDRTLAIVRATEMFAYDVSDTGELATPPTHRKLKEWNGNEWVEYVANSDCVEIP